MIKLNDRLHSTDEQASKAKVKFNRDNGYDDPIDIYKSNPDLINKQWLYWRNKNRYFDVGQIAICLVKIRSEYWLLTTIDTVVEELNVLRVYLKTVNMPKQRVFPPAVRHFSLQYTKYSCGKMTSSDEKSLAVGHIPGFQIDPNWSSA